MSDSTMLIRRKGICENPDCDMCMTRTVQEIEPGEDFICAECGLPLKEVSDKKTKKSGQGGNKGLLYGVIGGVVLLGGGAAGWFMMGDSDKDTEGNEINIESISFDNDLIEVTPAGSTTAVVAIDPAESNEPLVWSSGDETIATVDSEGNVTGVNEGSTTITVVGSRSGKETSADVKVTKAETGSATGNGTTTSGSGTGTDSGTSVGKSSGKLTMTYGTYDGPVSAGKANGLGGVFTFNRSFTLDLKDGHGNTVELASGDKIIDSKFTDGKLRQGEIHFKDGSRKYISGLNQAL